MRKIVCGLGNPGTSYVNTRHNAGFMVLDAFAAHRRASFGRPRDGASTCRLSDGVLLVKPNSFMNASGAPVAALARYYRVAAADVLLVVDCLALEVGRLRLARGGGHAGHNGTRSVTQHLGTPSYPRLRIGIAPPGKVAKPDPDFVISEFGPAERVLLDEAVAKAVQAIEMYLANGVDKAMNEFN